jgi:NAD(P)-dependent dehydrogenase (short-subunit alcohol dehydrogenase family)
MQNKICIVTHVNASIGQAGADALAAEGAKVIVSDASFADEGRRQSYSKQHPKLDVTATLDPEKLIDEIMVQHGRVDVLVANVALPPEPVAIEKTQVDDLRHALDVLAIEPFRLVKAVSKHMKKQKSGKIIFVTSDAPRLGLANHTVYCTAQGAANALMGTLAQELADSNIQVNAVGPAHSIKPTYFPKEMMGEATAEKIIVGKGSAMRPAKPENAGALVAFLSSPGSDFIMGEVIPFAGGWI